MYLIEMSTGQEMQRLIESPTTDLYVPSAHRTQLRHHIMASATSINLGTYDA